jgi:hypothetical protein
MMRYAPLFHSTSEPVSATAVAAANASAVAGAVAAASVTLSEATLAIALDEHRFVLDDGRVARQAPSCVLALEAGDRVLVSNGRADVYVLHVLKRADPSLAELSVPGASELRIMQQRLTLQAGDDLALRSLRNVEISAATGLLSLHADNMSTTVNQALVESMRHYVGSAEQYLLDVSALLRLHGQQTMVCAEKDVKVDGQRISVG